MDALALCNLDRSIWKQNHSAPRNWTAWRHANVGRLLNNAVRRFEARVLELMSDKGHDETRIAHVSLTRELLRGGDEADRTRPAGFYEQAGDGRAGRPMR